jgi:hypothetical protein
LPRGEYPRAAKLSLQRAFHRRRMGFRTLLHAW